MFELARFAGIFFRHQSKTVGNAQKRVAKFFHLITWKAPTWCLIWSASSTFVAMVCMARLRDSVSSNRESQAICTKDWTWMPKKHGIDKSFFQAKMLCTGLPTKQPPNNGWNIEKECFQSQHKRHPLNCFQLNFFLEIS